MRIIPPITVRKSFLMTEKAIPAATILLLRDAPSLEVLMIERHENMAFAGGAMAFPGGRIEAADGDKAWAEHCTGLGAIPEEQHGPRVAAIREAYEETGILLARRRGEQSLVDETVTQKLDEQRSAVEVEADLFLSLIKEENLTLACDALFLFARWSPPQEAKHRRYNTWFFRGEDAGKTNGFRRRQ